MITFWVDEAGAFCIRNYLAERGKALRDRIVVRPYRWVNATIEVAKGTHIFAALDQLTAPELEGVSALSEQLGDQAVLNRPGACLLRPALLAALADRGVNTFRAYPAKHADRVSRFPAFVRGAYDHGGNLTGLLGSPGELRRVLRALRLRGYPLAELLVVEFCDTSGRDGIFRKYSAFRLGDSIVPAHLLAGREWMMKSGSAERTLELSRESLDYIERNPHATWVREIFNLAGVEFGRLDYGLLGDRPQAWEINLNPTLGRQPGSRSHPLDPATTEVWKRSRDLAHELLRDAFTGLDRSGPSGTATLGLDPALCARIARASRKRRRHRTARGLVRWAFHSPLGAPLRALLPRVS